MLRDNLFLLPGEKKFIAVDFKDQKSVVTLFDLDSGERLKEYPHDSAVYSLATDSVGKKFAAGLQDGSCVVWDIESGKKTATLTGHDGSINSLFFDKEEEYLVTASSAPDSTIRRWKIADGKFKYLMENVKGNNGVGAGVEMIKIIPSPDKSMILVRCGMDKTTVIGAKDGKEIWKSDVAEEINTFFTHAWSPDSKMIAAWLSDGKTHLVDVVDGTEKWSVAGLFRPRIIFSPDGKTIALSSKGVSAGGVLLLGAADGSVKWAAHLADVDPKMRDWNSVMAFSPDGGGIYCSRCYFPEAVCKFDVASGKMAFPAPDTFLGWGGGSLPEPGVPYRYSIIPSPDGACLYACSLLGGISVLDRKKQSFRTLLVPDRYFREISFLGDGKTLLASGVKRMTFSGMSSDEIARQFTGKSGGAQAQAGVGAPMGGGPKNNEDDSQVEQTMQIDAGNGQVVKENDPAHTHPGERQDPVFVADAAGKMGAKITGVQFDQIAIGKIIDGKFSASFTVKLPYRPFNIAFDRDGILIVGNLNGTISEYSLDWPDKPASIPMTVPAPAEGEKPGFEKGKFQTVAKEMSDLLMLKPDGKSLKLDRGHWDKIAKSPEERKQELVDKYVKQGMAKDEAERLAGAQLDPMFAESDPMGMVIERLQLAAGRGGSGSSEGDGQRQFDFNCGGLSGAISIKQKAFNATFTEDIGPKRTIEFSDDGKGTFMLSIKNRAGEILNISQAAGGRFSITGIFGKEAIQLSGDSFLAIYEKDWSCLEDSVLPLLRHIGVGLPILPYSPQVRQAVLDLLRKPIAAEEKEKINALLKNLDSDNAAERDAVSKTLGENFIRYYGFIIPCLKSDSAEVKQRIKKLIADHPEQSAVGQFIHSLKLTEDVAYLVGLLAKAKEEDKQPLVAGLEKLTGEKHGANLAAWREYVKKKTSASAPAK
ncbi:MAG: PQQ-binding-like beta-propeller repeat protein [Planctomycetes bacterium]|nr:PQQ-binding-like beta-propeller repeat protein [Planctomycetota bacterium]